jgi:hypothetical protein
VILLLLLMLLVVILPALWCCSFSFCCATSAIVNCWQGRAVRIHVSKKCPACPNQQMNQQMKLDLETL